MLPTPSHTLSKKERLCNSGDITRLVTKGHYGYEGSIKFCYVSDNGLPYSRILVSVSKKFFKRAVKRNLLKRRIRESFRTQKELLGGIPGIDIMFSYNTREVLDSAVIKACVGQILTRISQDVKV